MDHNKLSALEAENKRLKAQVDRKNPAKGASKGNKSKDKGRGDKSRSNWPLPKALAGGNAVYNGQPICFSFNLKGCSHKGSQCDKGVHRCMKCMSPDHGMGSCTM